MQSIDSFVSLGEHRQKTLLFDMKNLPHEIMIFLLDNYYTDTPMVQINGLLINISTGNIEKVRCVKIKTVLNILEGKKYLTWDVSRYDELAKANLPHPSFKPEFATQQLYGFQDLSNNNIMAALMPEGIDYAIDIIRKRVQHRNNNWAIIFSGLTVVITLATLFNQCNSQSRLRQDRLKAQQSQEQLQSLDSIVQIHQSGLNYLIQGKKNDSVKNDLENPNLKDTAALKSSPTKKNHE
jgi:hypothetical protein